MGIVLMSPPCYSGLTVSILLVACMEVDEKTFGCRNYKENLGSGQNDVSDVIKHLPNQPHCSTAMARHNKPSLSLTRILDVIYGRIVPLVIPCI